MLKFVVQRKRWTAEARDNSSAAATDVGDRGKGKKESEATGTNQKGSSEDGDDGGRRKGEKESVLQSVNGTPIGYRHSSSIQPKTSSADRRQPETRCITGESVRSPANHLGLLAHHHSFLYLGLQSPATAL